MEGDKIPLNWINAGLVRQTSRSTNDGNECEATVAQSDSLSEPLLGPSYALWPRRPWTSVTSPRVKSFRLRWCAIA